MPVAVVTDSTAYLPAEVVAQYGIHVVPLYVVLAGRSGREGTDIRPEDVARALGARRQQVSTSRPTSGDFLVAFRRCLENGADHVVSVHLSAELSGTSDAARVAAGQVGEHLVTVLDSRSAAMGCGFAVLAAARTAAEGADARTVAERAASAAQATSTFFVVDTLEHLRRGGRIGSAAAILGSALAVKPVLHMHEGRVVPLEKVRTSARALARLVQRAVESAGEGPVSLAVHHLAAPERAERIAAELRERLPRLRELYVSELGAAIGAHVGPGAVGVVVAPSSAPWPEPPDDVEEHPDDAS